MNLIRSFLSKTQKVSEPFGPLANPLGKVRQPEPGVLKAAGSRHAIPGFIQPGYSRERQIGTELVTMGLSR